MKLSLSLIYLLSFFICNAQRNEKYDALVDSFSKLNQTEKLIPYFEKELQSKPDNEDALRWLGYLDIAFEKYDEGEKNYQRALAIDPACTMCYVNIGRMYSLKNDNKKALEFMNRAMQIDSADAYTYAMKALIEQLLGDNFSFSSDIDKAIKLDPSNPSYYITRGFNNFKNGYTELALFDMHQAVKYSPNSYASYFQRGRIYHAKYREQEALSDYNKAIELDSTQAVVYSSRGDVYAALNQYQNAIDDYTKALKINPSDFRTLYSRATNRFALEDMEGTCIDMTAATTGAKKEDPDGKMLQAIKTEMANYCDSTKPGFYYQRGIGFFNARQFENSIKILSAGLKKFPGNAMSFNQRATAYFELKDYTSALADYTAVIKNRATLFADFKSNNNDKSDDIINGYADVLVAAAYLRMAEINLVTGHLYTALDQINQSINISPNNSPIGNELPHIIKGNILLILGRSQEAADDLAIGIKINPSYALGYIMMAAAQINALSNTETKPFIVSGDWETPTFRLNPQYTFTRLKATDPNVISALLNCDKAIGIKSDPDMAYYIKGVIKKIISDPEYCTEIMQAKAQGYKVEPELLKECDK